MQRHVTASERASVAASAIAHTPPMLNDDPAASLSTAVRVRVPLLMRFTAFAVWVAAVVWSSREGMLRAYGDAISHELISRRILDSISPGLAQLGTVWLPLPPLLLLPLTAFDVIWHAGIAGAILGFFYLQISAGALYRIGAMLGNSATGWVAALVFITNPNALYLMTTPLTEGPSFAFLTLCGASMVVVLEGLAMREPRPGPILSASAFAAAMLLCRYDGWMLALICGVMITGLCYRWIRRRLVTEAVTLAYIVTPASAIALWLLYNILIFGDALSFLRGQYSSAGIVDDLAVRGVIPTRDGKVPELGRPVQALLTYLQAAAENAGSVVCVLALAGFMIALYRLRHHPKNLVLVALASPLVFYIFALTAGQSVIVTRTLRPMGIFNVRYGAMILPFIAVCVALLVTPLEEKTWRLAVPVALIAIVGNLLLLGDPLGPVVVAEGRLQQRAITYSASIQAAEWFASQPYDPDRKVLLDDALEPQMQVVLVGSGRPLSAFITSSTPDFWREARVNPPVLVEWVVVLGPKSRDRPNDRVAKDLVQPDNTMVNFIPVFNNGEMIIFRRG